MTILLFDGEEDAYWWILCLEKFFKEHETPKSLKVLKAVGALRGSAFTWWIWWCRVHPRYNWDTFTTALLWRFKPEWRPILPLDDEDEEPPYESTQSFYSTNISVEENPEEEDDPAVESDLKPMKETYFHEDLVVELKVVHEIVQNPSSNLKQQVVGEVQRATTASLLPPPKPPDPTFKINNSITPPQFSSEPVFLEIYDNPFEPWEIPASLKDSSLFQNFSANNANVKGCMPNSHFKQGFDGDVNFRIPPKPPDSPPLRVFTISTLFHQKQLLPISEVMFSSTLILSNPPSLESILGFLHPPEAPHPKPPDQNGFEFLCIKTSESSSHVAHNVFVEISLPTFPLFCLNTIMIMMGIDYDCSNSADSDIFVAYGLEKYVAAVVHAVKDVCNCRNVKHPVICSESGSAIMSYHSILIFEAIGASTNTAPSLSSIGLQYLATGLSEQALRGYLQHRGQEGAGIVTVNNNLLQSIIGVGLVSDVFNESKLDQLPGSLAIDHVRYSTAGQYMLKNIQPFVVGYHFGSVGVAHNGNLVNYRTLRAKLEETGSIFNNTYDTEIVLHLISTSKHRPFILRTVDACEKLEEVYSVVFVTEDKLVAVRDPFGFRPMVMGRISNGAVVFASETCALDLFEAPYERKVFPGEVVVDDDNGIQSFCLMSHPQPKQCIFEHNYFALPNYVDFKGKPVLKQNIGNWKACLFILGNECGERLAYYGIAKNIVTYLTRKLHQGNVSAARNVTTWKGTCYLSPLIGAVLVDSYWGDTGLLLFFFSAIYFIGMCTLTLSASIPTLKPANYSGSVCPPATLVQYASFFFGLYLIELGTGGIKPCMSSFGVDQFDDTDSEERIKKGPFFNWFYFSINIGTFVSSTFIVWTQENAAWGIGFGIPALFMACSYVHSIKKISHFHDFAKQVK